MLPLQDRESVGPKIPKTGRTLKSVKAMALIVGRNPGGTKHEGRPPLHSFDAHNVQKPFGTDKKATGVGHSSNAATHVPDVLRWQLLQQLAMLSLSIIWRDTSSHSQ